MEFSDNALRISIVIAVVAIAAGAWATPMLVVQTGHTLLADITTRR